MNKNSFEEFWNNDQFVRRYQNPLNNFNKWHKKIEFLQRYRKTLIDFSDKCVCLKTSGIKSVVKSLEVEYKSVFNGNMSKSETVVEKTDAEEEMIIPNEDQIKDSTELNQTGISSKF